MLEEARIDVEARVEAFKRKVGLYFNKRVRPRSFRVGDLVLKEIGVTTVDEGTLGRRWEGPYVVVASHRSGAYHLKGTTGCELPHPWNVEHLRKYYTYDGKYVNSYILLFRLFNNKMRAHVFISFHNSILFTNSSCQGDVV